MISHSLRVAFGGMLDILSLTDSLLSGLIRISALAADAWLKTESELSLAYFAFSSAALTPPVTVLSCSTNTSRTVSSISDASMTLNQI